MALYQINISYDGTEFCGYQRQRDKRTVQGELETALKKIGWEGKSILSSGRTDAGVHADGQVAAFHLDWKHDEEALLQAINSKLPEDLSILNIFQRDEESFHPRYQARSRIYRYQVYVSPFRLPINERFHHRIWPLPDLELMNAGSEQLLGRHDFSRFGRPYRHDGRTDRIVKTAGWSKAETEERYFFRIEANSFLYHMVRRIVFVLLKLGQGKIDIKDVANALDGIDNLPPGIAPAKGLFLERINY